MLSVRMQVELKVPPDDVWNVVGRFNDLPEWVPAFEKISLSEDGKVRHLTLAGGGGEIVEQLEDHSDGDRFYRYSIVSAPLPLSNYVSTVRVIAQGSGDHSIVDWSSHFTADGVPDEEAVGMVEGLYQAGFDRLQEIFSD